MSTGIALWDGNEWQRMRLDPESLAATVIQSVHHHIHQGEHFSVIGYDSLDATETTEFIIETPSDKDIHMAFAYSSNKAFTFEMWEDVTYTGGTATSPINSNRQSSNTSSLLVKKNPTTVDTASATKLIEISIGAGGGPFNPTEIISSRENEIILKQNAIYYYKLTSNENSSVVTYYGTWYEID